METSATKNEQQQLALELGQLIGQASMSSLAMLFEPSIELSVPESEEFSTLEALTQAIEPEQFVMAVSYFQGHLSLPVAFFFPLTVAVAMANHLMGETAEPIPGELTDIQMSAMGEVVSQMMSASSNSIYQILSKPMQITPPNIGIFRLPELMEAMPEITQSSITAMRYQITGSTIFPDTTMFQIMPNQAFFSQLSTLTALHPENFDTDPDGLSMNGPVDSPPSKSALDNSQAYVNMPNDAQGTTPQPAFSGVGPSAGGQGNPMGGGGGAPITVQPVAFPSFDTHVSSTGPVNKNLDLLMDVQLNITVELGRAELSIKEVLELTRGSVIELNRVAGESVDLFVNGKMIAKGEVVVIEDNFGLRITSIVSPADRLRGL